MSLPNLVGNLARFIHIVSILALTTLHDLAKSCKKLGEILMLHILSIIAFTLHDLAKFCKKLDKIHKLHILSILPYMILPNLTRNLARLCMV